MIVPDGQTPIPRVAVIGAGFSGLVTHETGLVVCGDRLAGGRIEGAFLSGVAAAGCLLRQVGISANKQRPTRNPASKTES